ncbi:GAF domain-containing sensor histidine kinase [Candidatus Nitrotoga sp. 1052]|uniref:GAF domain-containing sensor histidine kinase n=1 Tax=Candidatus Nitrotoga sp. 1052 TaxID=2886964 RepID=UPI001EF5ACCA|nr:GAF domain-containing sensor histidine kinase [Candidatus Nitrotoga sp. 1052]CAH1075328.1 Histidine kinase [Candidatus Nitrotoga sp. 1052]
MVYSLDDSQFSIASSNADSNVKEPLFSTNEVMRLHAVRRYDILDTPPDGTYDRITALAARLFNVPIAIVSIVDSDRIWFKSHFGVEATEVGREPGLCASAILQNGPYVIEDAAHDARALTNPLVVGELGLRFYVAVPLTTSDGFNLGTLCVIDKKPRILNNGELTNLQDLASLVIDQLELRLNSIRTIVKLDNAKCSAENASLTKSDVISNLAHELQSPLNSILGFAQLLQMDKLSLTPSQLFNINQIIQAGWHQSKLIEEHLSREAIESGRLPVRVESLCLFSILRECQAMMKPQAQIKNIYVSFNQSENPIYIYADRTRLKQIFINLISNAIKYNQPGGTVSIECISNLEWVLINIKDTGSGIPLEKLGQLFQAYNRLGQESGAEEGTGLGLVVTKKLVEMMGGTIGVESTVGVGTIFWIKLPSEPSGGGGVSAIEFVATSNG